MKLMFDNNTIIVSPPKSYFSLTNYYATLADTAVTHHYLDEKAKLYCTEQHQTHGPNIQVANGDISSPISQSAVKVSNKLSKKAQHSYVFDNLVTGSLLSIEQLFDDDCIALFSKFYLKYSRTSK